MDIIAIYSYLHFELQTTQSQPWLLLKAQPDVYFDDNTLFMILGKVMPYYLFCNSKAHSSDEVFASGIKGNVVFVYEIVPSIYC